MKEDISGAEDGEDGDEAKTGRRKVEIGMCGDGDCVRGVVLVVVGCPSEADVADGAVDVVLWKDDITELTEVEFFGNVV